jgi:DNA/RNA endonuclease YhcR with UshA esterase domain
MFMRQERVALLLLVGVAISVIACHLLFISIGKGPFASAFSNRSADGELVMVHGAIEQVTILANGGHVLLEIDGATVFIPAQVAGDLSFARGADISLYGTVQTFRGKKEIVVNSADDLQIMT